MKWSVHKAATEFGVSRETIVRGLKQLGIEVNRNSTFTTKQIFTSIAGDLKFERTRRERAEADKAEVEAAAAKRTRIPREDVVTFIRESFAPLRELVVAMPAQMAGLVNPADPHHAREHLERWRDEFLKHKEHLPPEPVERKETDETTA